jgi:phospholipid-binding lipoprotein MlaA
MDSPARPLRAHATLLLSLGFALIAGLALPHAASAEETARAAHQELPDTDEFFSDDFVLEDDPHDPLEGMNRRIFRGNRVLDRWLFEPLTRGYRFVLPAPVRRSVRGIFENLGSPGVIVNNVLQGEGEKARETSARFVVNTTVGLAGIWDPATRIGYHAHEADFGQTLGKAGVGSGPYLVLPVFGPNTTRDLVGGVVDIALRPDTWLLPFGSLLVLGSTDGISIKEATLEEVNALEASSVDFYAAMRSAYLMNRNALVHGNPNAYAVPAVSSPPSPLVAPLPLP